MIDRTHRFQGHGSLRFVYQKGKVVRGPYSALKYIHNSRRTTYRAAVVVSRKVHKSAVVRNRIRRRVYEIIREAAPQIHGPFDLVFIMYTDQVATMPAADLRAAIRLQLQKADCLREASAHPAAPHAIVKPKEN
jgi:ribonuclease P protein component